MVVNGDEVRMVLVEVTGLRWQKGPSTCPATFKVPYRSLARTLQFVKQRGGQIVRVQVMTAPPLPQFPPPTAVQTDAPSTPPPPANRTSALPSDTAETPVPPGSTSPEGLPTPGWLTVLAKKVEALFRNDSGG
jgi:hypothetical protein